MKTYQENLEAADELLAKAAAVEPTDRFHYAKTYAEMASAHAALAHVQLLEQVNTPPRLVVGDINVSPQSGRVWTVPPADDMTGWEKRPEMSEHQKRALREREVEELDIASKPIWERPWPHNVIKATAVSHPGTSSNLSREFPSYFLVTGATEQAFVGKWVEGAGFVDAEADRAGCSPVPIRERLLLARCKVRVI